MKCSLFFVFLFFLYLKWLIIRVDVKKFKKIFVKCLQISKFCGTFATAIERDAV